MGWCPTWGPKLLPGDKRFKFYGTPAVLRSFTDWSNEHDMGHPNRPQRNLPAYHPKGLAILDKYLSSNHASKEETHGDIVDSAKKLYVLGPREPEGSYKLSKTQPVTGTSLRRRRNAAHVIAQDMLGYDRQIQSIVPVVIMDHRVIKGGLIAQPIFENLALVFTLHDGRKIVVALYIEFNGGHNDAGSATTPLKGARSTASNAREGVFQWAFSVSPRHAHGIQALPRTLCARHHHHHEHFRGGGIKCRSCDISHVKTGEVGRAVDILRSS